MKTTNKILVITILIGFAASTYFMLKIASFIHVEVVELSGITSKKDIPIEQFESVVIKNSINVQYVVSTENKLIIEADTVLFKHLVTSNQDGKLILNLNTPLPESQHALATLYSRTPRSIKVDQGATFISMDTLYRDTLYLNLQRGSRISLNAKLTHLDCHQWEGTEVEITGKSYSSRIDANNGSRFYGNNFETSKADVSASAGSQLSVFVTGSLNIKAHTGGMVEYKGNPSINNLELKSGGTATNAN